MVLFLVVIVVTIISLAGFSFTFLMSTEHKAVRLHGDELQLLAIAGSAEEYLKTFLEQPWQVQQDVGGDYDNPAVFRDVMVLEDPGAGRNGRFSVVSPRIEDGEVRGLRFGLENESAKLNLGAVLYWDKLQAGLGQQILLKLPGMTEPLADAILDWMDADSRQRPFGAEADYYATRGVPYGPRNSMPVSLEELLLVKGVTRSLIFGNDANFNHLLDAGETQSYGERLETLQAGAEARWSALLTVHSAERNVTPDGEPRIWLNDPDLAGLYRRLAAAFDRATAEFVVAYRQFGPYAGPKPPGPSVPFQVRFTFAPKFSFNSVLDLIGAKVRAAVPSARSYAYLTSPLATEMQAIREYLPRWMDYTSTVNLRSIPGRVNINLASRTVLQCVPGMYDNLIGRILANRQPGGHGDDPDRRHATWLLTEGLVDLPRMKSLLPFITGSGEVCRAQIVAFFDRPGPTARVELVIDATGPAPRQVYWKDLRIFGRGYPQNMISEISTDRTGRKDSLP